MSDAESPSQRARREALEARERAYIAHHTNPMVGIPSSVASGVMMGGLAGVLSGGAVLFMTRDPNKAMTVVAKGTGICSVSGIVLNVSAYIYTHRSLFTGRTESSTEVAVPASAAGKN